MSKPVVILITIGAWMVGCAYTAYQHVTSVLGPPCVADAYACDWGFQLAVFGIVRLPFWAMGLLVVVAAEVVLLKPTRGKLR